VSETNRMEKHLTLLGVFHIIYHSLSILVGLGIFALMSTIGCITGDPVAMRILTTIGGIVGTILIVLGVPGVVAGIWLLKRQSWARILAFIVGAFDILDIPLGTALGIYTYWVLLDDDTEALLH